MRKMNQAGFSLVELMVVVAIIGVLATVAIPRVNKFIAKARTSEAQTNLSSIYTFNKNFYVEFQGYTNNISAMGYMPEGNLRYNVGWTAASSIPPNYAALGKTAPNTNVNSLAACPTTATATCKTLVGGTGAAPPAVTGSAISATWIDFTAAAAAVLTGTGTEDRWTIDQSKFMVNTQDGTN